MNYVIFFSIAVFSLASALSHNLPRFRLQENHFVRENLGFVGYNLFNRRHGRSLTTSAVNTYVTSNPNRNKPIARKNSVIRRSKLHRKSINRTRRLDEHSQAPEVVKIKEQESVYHDISFGNLESRDHLEHKGIKRCDQKSKGSKGTTTSERNLALYTKFKTLITVYSDIFNELGIYDEIKKLIPFFHWDIWQSISRGQLRTCNWSKNQFQDYLNILGKLDDHIIAIYDDIFKTVTTLSDNVKESQPQKDLKEQLTPELIQSMFENIANNYKSEISSKRSKNLGCIKNFFERQILKAIESIISNSITPYSTVAHELIGKFINIGDKKQKERLSAENYFEYLYGKVMEPRIFQDPRNIERLNIYHKHVFTDWMIKFIGTGSKMPALTRLTSSMAFFRKLSPYIWLFDCGEGIKHGLEILNHDPTNVNKIFITHLHGDHCLGLFAFLYMRRNVPLEVYGPTGIRDFIHEVHKRTSCMENLDCIVYELEVNGNNKKSENNIKGQTFVPDTSGCLKVFEDEVCTVHAAPLDHKMPTVGYVITEKFKDSNLGKVPRKIVICQDSSNSDKMIPIAKDATILIHEATINSPTPSTSNILLSLIRDYKSVEFSKGVVGALFNFASSLDLRINCLSHTKANLNLFLSKNLSTMLGKLDCTKELIDGFIKAPKIHPNDMQKQVLKQDKTRSEYICKQYKFMKLNWLSQIKNLISRLKLIKELNKLGTPIKRLKKHTSLLLRINSLLQNEFSFRKTSLAYNNILVGFSNELKFKGPNRSETPKIEMLDSIYSQIYEYWDEHNTEKEKIRNPEDKDWWKLLNKITESYGHSTSPLAADFAIKTDAKRLILTHFTSKYAGDSKLSSVLTMARIEHDARMTIKNHFKSKPTKLERSIPVTAAWDGYVITL
ncbi:hypothetical protein BEWA_033570 [Theileria equi strain WA]|uniref:Uncharacterized protein n=1 Tax=Theileria equi strain WA TaxID=1537102 RepID=L0AY42_THEEQ|nr:hypothetical protein BEWA_033570 [Theileria equi strain WA]AFZ80502.1 hypothetical protein BEWA_033570 [Theileria equi strain WA]|eukprot:XP_004830168.1 hypothetical protein BEWA_033570 [Theileria equi strain WA]